MIIIMLRTKPCISGQKGNNIGGPRKKSSGWAGIPPENQNIQAKMRTMMMMTKMKI